MLWPCCPVVLVTVRETCLTQKRPFWVSCVTALSVFCLTHFCGSCGFPAVLSLNPGVRNLNQTSRRSGPQWPALCRCSVGLARPRRSGLSVPDRQRVSVDNRAQARSQKPRLLRRAPVALGVDGEGVLQVQAGDHHRLSGLEHLSLRVRYLVDLQSSEGRVAHRNRSAKWRRMRQQRHLRLLQRHLPIMQQWSPSWPMMNGWRPSVRRGTQL